MEKTIVSFRKIDARKPVTVFHAKNIVTMNHNQPEADAVAVQDGIIVGVGDRKELHAALKYRDLAVIPNAEFEYNVIYPGFIEAHMHPVAMGMFIENFVYLGYFDRNKPDGGILKGLKTFDEIIDEIKKQIALQRDKLEKGSWFSCWAFDPLLHDGKFLTRDILDSISTEYPIAILHQSGHGMNLNTKGLEVGGYFALAEEQQRDANIFRAANGEMNGAVFENNIMYAIEAGAMRPEGNLAEVVVNAIATATKIARRNGCTTICDKGLGINPPMPGEQALALWQNALAQERLATRVQVEPYSVYVLETNSAKTVQASRAAQNDMLTIGNFKIIIDGSIQGYTAHLLDKRGYVSGAPNGQLLLDKDTLKKLITEAENYGFSCSIHTNGDGATELAIQCIEELRAVKPERVFRHSLEHCQLATEEHFYRMAKNNISCNLFASHLYYWGDVHARFTVGPDVVRRMDACRSAINHSVVFGLHSDDMVTEVAPLFCAWSACNRKSGVSGKIYGEDQCLTVDEALRAITYNHAWMLGMDDVVGSVEIGKYADFTVLAEEVTEANRETFRSIPVVGTVLAGKVHLNCASVYCTEYSAHRLNRSYPHG